MTTRRRACDLRPRSALPIRRRAGAALLVLLGSAAAPRAAAGQDPGAAPAAPPGWNDARALELVARARERRQEPVADSLLQSYRADGTGHIYFFLDREEAGDPVLLRADQVALELYWAQPGRVKQVIRGMRSEEQFPIRDFAYYLDRYTVIQNGFDDEIRVGEGRDVADVPHPLAPGAAAVYDYRLADSLTIRLPGRADPIRVYEIQVRPRDFGIPAIVGSLFVERARADLVRLAFTFTPSAYLDPRNERVEIALENALWEGRYWLPREQRLLVRREIPELDLDVGTVIRAVLRITDYELNPALPPAFFTGRSVVAAAGPEGLAAYPFEEGLFEGLDDVGLAAGADPGTLDAVDVEAIAGRILRQRFLRGVPRLRFYAPNASAIARYDRAEGLVTGGGLAFGLGEYQLTGYGAWAWAADRPTVEVAARPLPGSAEEWAYEGYYRRPVDLGARPAAAGVLSSLTAAVAGDDYRDLYFASGFTLTREFRGGRGRALSVGATVEEHASAALEVAEAPLTDEPFRAVVPIDEVREFSTTVRLRLAGDGPRGGGAEARLALRGGFQRGGRAEDGWFAVATLDAERSWRGPELRWGVDVRPTVRLTLDAPFQHGALVGGRNTLPGHPFRAYYADQLVLAAAEAWMAVVPRWLRLRATAAGAWVDGRRNEAFLGSLGAGIGLIDGILRIDWARGFGGDDDAPPLIDPTAPGYWPEGPPPGGGVWTLSIDPRLWPFL